MYKYRGAKVYLKRVGIENLQKTVEAITYTDPVMDVARKAMEQRA